jgi:hypothetical protein
MELFDSSQTAKLCTKKKTEHYHTGPSEKASEPLGFARDPEAD